MSLSNGQELMIKGRLAAQLALLLPPQKRRILGTACIAAAGAFAITYYVQKYNAKNTSSKKSSKRDSSSSTTTASKGKKRPPSGQALKQLLPLLLKVAGRKVIFVIFLAIARTALSNRLARLQGYLFRAAFLRKVPLFARNLIENILLCGVAAGLEATTRSWISMMDLQWRKMLTSRFHSSYFTNMMYYKLNYVDRRIDSPEQRICEDIPKLSSGLSDLTKEIIIAVVDAVFYSWQLRRYSKTNKYTVAILAYVFGVGTFMTIAAPNFGGLFKKQQVLEGSYRHMHSRLKTNAESVAFYGGIPKEGELIRSKFAGVADHAALLLSKQWYFSMVQDFLLKYLGATVAVALIIGPFFAGHMRPESTVMGRAQMLSNMRYHTSVIISLFGALGTLGASSRKFLKLGAYADRIEEMRTVIKEIAGGQTTGTMGDIEGTIGICDDAIEFEGATVVTPGNATLVRDLTLRVPAGTNLLVTGPNGAGKSSLFRVLGGLWPLTQGTIKKPGGGGEGGLSHEIFYVPQKPYVTVGTLQDQLLYPLSSNEEHNIPEDQLRALLRNVDLEYLLDRPHSTTAATTTCSTETDARDDAITNWGEVLSLGEQQRLGMARLFFHKPRFAILDECTSGVTVEMEERFCTMVRDMGCTCVTISHRPALMAFHDIVLNLDGEGGWSLHEGHRALAVKDITGSNDKEEGEEEGHGRRDGRNEENSNKETSKEKKGHDVEEQEEGNHCSSSHMDDNQNASSLLLDKEIDKKVRSKDVNSLLAGMNITLAERPLLDDNQSYSEIVLASAPAANASPASSSFDPGVTLRPHSRSTASRWNSVLRILIGNDIRDSTVRLTTVTGVIILRTILQDRIANLNGRSVDLVLRQNLPGFVRLIGVSILQSAASSVLAPSLRHVADSLALTWRVRLTRAITQRYLSDKTFYTASHLAGMNDVDQRITRDVERLADDLSALIPTLMKPIVDITWFSWQLWRLTGRRGIFIAYAYTAVGYGCLRAVTPDFAKLLKREYYLEGAFRNAHTRLKTHAESIAFFDGGVKEGAAVTGAFASLTRHLASLIRLRWSYGAADEFFAKQLPHSTTWVLTLLYALEQKGDFGNTAFQGALVHNIRYLASVVTQCFSAVGELLAMPKRFAEISGCLNRVSELVDVIENAKALEAVTLEQQKKQSPSLVGNDTSGIGGTGSKPLSAISDDCIAFDNVDVVTPGGKVLVRALTFSVCPGQSLLVTGPNGSGKTSLFRLLGGLWPLTDDTVSAVHKPGSQLTPLDSADIYYVPQKPYATIGTLREQIIYPMSTSQARRRAMQKTGEEGEQELLDPAAALDAELEALMDVVRLKYLVDREGGWDAVREWGEVLSLGEQQRIGMARLFYHKPRFGVLDECTNATSVDVEEALYAHAEGLGITMVTITQRTALVKYHGRELKLVDGEGGWELREIRKMMHPKK